MSSPPITPWMILPFGILLGAIAVMPLLGRHWWERHYPKVVLLLGSVTLIYYLGILHEHHRPIESFHEYISFICLIGSLFVVSGGIHIRVKGESTPTMNVILLAVGGILANIIGTTGASMLLVRPFLRANKYRLTTYHIVFFIFIVSNVGGSLTPIGDPPLYLGYLKGIPFFWTTHALFPIWFVGMTWLLTLFYIFDYNNFMRAPQKVREKETSHETWKFEGLGNLGWIAIILVALFIKNPPYLREAIMIAVAWISRRITKSHIYQANDFSWAPVREVAILFAGIFITMMPALDWLEMNAAKLGFSSVTSFYWGSGILSSVLDNAPTYLNFLSASMGLFINDSMIQGVQQVVAQGGVGAFTGTQSDHLIEILNTIKALQLYHPEALRTVPMPLHDIQICYLLGNRPLHIAAISIGAVFFGACTYIGNGPNFMVKNIAEHAGAKMPTFFGYIFKFTLPILLPMLIAIGWFYFR